MWTPNLGSGLRSASCTNDVGIHSDSMAVPGQTSRGWPCGALWRLVWCKALGQNRLCQRRLSISLLPAQCNVALLSECNYKKRTWSSYQSFLRKTLGMKFFASSLLPPKSKPHSSGWFSGPASLLPSQFMSSGTPVPSVLWTPYSSHCGLLAESPVCSPASKPLHMRSVCLRALLYSLGSLSFKASEESFQTLLP